MQERPCLAFARALSIALLLILSPTSKVVSQQTGPSIPPEPVKPQPGTGGTAYRDPGRGLYNQNWALVVGINRFKHPKVAPLSYAVNDAHAVSDTLIRLGFPEKNITVLINDQASKQEIEQILSSGIRKATSSEDQLVIFFATHGVTSPLPDGREEGYLLPYDTDPDELPLTALSMQQLKQIAQRIPAKHILIAIDACYGGYALVRAQAPPAVDRRYWELVAKSRVIQVMTAGKKDQPVLEDQGQGVFTRKFIQGLAGLADVNRDGLITVPELGAWMQPLVAQDSEYKQDMQWGTLDGEGQFVFVLPQTGTPVAMLPKEPPTGDQSDLAGLKKEVATLKTEVEKWKKELERVTERLKPTDVRPDKEIQKGLGLFDSGQYEEAVHSFNRVLEIDPGKREATIYKAQALHKLGRGNEALETIDRGIQVNPQSEENWWFWHAKGDILLAMKRCDEARKSFNGALATSPKYLSTHQKRQQAVKECVG